MDHQYIDQHDIAGRYRRQELPAAERDAFQAHLVDCSECSDRVLLAEMLAPTGATPQPAAQPPLSAAAVALAKLPLRARIVAYLSPLQLAMLLMLFVLVLLALPTLVFWWELQSVRR